MANKTIEELAAEELARRSSGETTGPIAPQQGSVEEQAQAELAARDVAEELARQEYEDSKGDLIQNGIATVAVAVKELLNNPAIPSEVKTGIAAAAGISIPSLIGKLVKNIKIHPAVTVAVSGMSTIYAMSFPQPGENRDDFRARLRFAMEDDGYSPSPRDPVIYQGEEEDRFYPGATYGPAPESGPMPPEVRNVLEYFDIINEVMERKKVLRAEGADEQQ